jgi:dipeptidyl aminopeptidase/acylaminoacyl peptidase
MEIITREIHFISDTIQLTGYLTYPDVNQKLPGVLFVHGGGKYADNLYAEWQVYLGTHGYASLFFYCRGVGTSEGDFTDSSLNHRLTDTSAAYDYFIQSGKVDPQKICVYGSSMGGHVALRLVEKIPQIQAVVLQSAAAYALTAESLPLNSEFTQEIQKPNSWSNSLVFEILQKYSGKTLVVYGEKDEVIPDGVKIKFQEIVGQFNYVTLANGTHRLLRPETANEKKAHAEMFEKVLFFLYQNLN